MVLVSGPTVPVFLLPVFPCTTCFAVLPKTAQSTSKTLLFVFFSSVLLTHVVHVVQRSGNQAAAKHILCRRMRYAAGTLSSTANMTYAFTIFEEVQTATQAAAPPLVAQPPAITIHPYVILHRIKTCYDICDGQSGTVHELLHRESGGSEIDVVQSGVNRVGGTLRPFVFHVGFRVGFRHRSSVWGESGLVLHHQNAGKPTFAIGVRDSFFSASESQLRDGVFMLRRSG